MKDKLDSIEGALLVIIILLGFIAGILLAKGG